MAPPTVFVSYSARPRPDGTGDKSVVAQLRDPLRKQLRDRGLRAWFDVDHIRGGDEWEPPIAAALSSCAAALVLVDRTALTSKYMLDEAIQLRFRRRNADLQVLPVLLGVTREEFLGSDLCRAGGYHEVSQRVEPPPGKPGNPAAMARRIVKELRDPPMPDDAAGRLVLDVAGYLGCVPPQVLGGMGKQLAVDPDVLALGPEHAQLLAAALLDADLHTAVLAVGELKDHLEGLPLRETVRRVVPLWVDLDKAKDLVRTADRDAGHPVVRLATGSLTEAEHVVQRGSAFSRSVGAHRLGPTSGENVVDELVARFTGDLRDALNVPTGARLDQVAALVSRRGRDKTAFALLRCDHVPPERIKSVMLELAPIFPGVVFVLVAPVGGPLWRSVDGAPAIDLTVDEEERLAIQQDILEAYELIDDKVDFDDAG